MLRHLTLAVLASMALAAASATVSQAADSLRVPAPMFVLDEVNEYFAKYSLVSTVSGQFEHTRWEMGVSLTCDNSKRGIGGRFDSEKTKHFVNPQHTVVIPLGALCEGKATWNAGGGGCSTCDGTGTSSPTTFSVPPGHPRRRYDPAEKAAAARLRAAARRRAAHYQQACLGGSIASCAIIPAFLGVAAYQDRIVNDPPSKNFRTRVTASRPAPHVFTASEAGAAAPAMNAFAAAVSDTLAAGGALTKAIDRAQGAFTAKSKRHEKRQLLDAARFGAKLATALDLLATRSAAAGKALTAAQPPALATPAEPPGAWDQARFDLADGGPSPALLAELRRLKLPSDIVAAARGSLASVPALPPTDAFGEGLADTELLAAERGAAAKLRAWAKRTKKKNS